MKVDYPTFAIGAALQAMWLLWIGWQIMYGKVMTREMLGLGILIAGTCQAINFISIVLIKKLYWDKREHR